MTRAKRDAPISAIHEISRLATAVETLNEKLGCECTMGKLEGLLRTLEGLSVSPGQGSVWEQIEKRVRKQQRDAMYKMLESVTADEAKTTAAKCYKHIKQVGKKTPALMRFAIRSWKGHDEVFWKALGDYLLLALASVKDVEYDEFRGTITVEYFDTKARREKDPAFIEDVISRIAFLLNEDRLPTDFTRFRRMAERSGKLGEMPAGAAAVLTLIPKII